jgi:hypothetical protein
VEARWAKVILSQFRAHPATAGIKGFENNFESINFVQVLKFSTGQKMLSLDEIDLLVVVRGSVQSLARWKLRWPSTVSLHRNDKPRAEQESW